MLEQCLNMTPAMFHDPLEHIENSGKLVSSGTACCTVLFHFSQMSCLHLQFYLHHLSLLVCAMDILLQSQLSEVQIQAAEEMLVTFQSCAVIITVHLMLTSLCTWQCMPDSGVHCGPTQHSGLKVLMVILSIPSTKYLTSCFFSINVSKTQNCLAAQTEIEGSIHSLFLFQHVVIQRTYLKCSQEHIQLEFHRYLISLEKNGEQFSNCLEQLQLKL